MNYPVGYGPTSVVVGDFNGDGKPDLAVADNGSGCVSILLGNGDGTFRRQVNYTTAGDPQSVAVGDFNADGKPDLVLANHNTNSVSVLINTTP